MFAKRYEQHDHTQYLKRQFLNFKYYPNSDSVQSFSQRFVNLCDECGYDMNSSLVIDKFISLLPTETQRRFNMQCQYQKTPLSTFETLQSIIDTITDIEFNHNNVMYHTSEKDNSNTSHKPSHNKNTHGNNSSHSTPKKDICTTHPSGSHTNAQCRNPTPNKPASSNSTSANTNTSSPYTPTKTQVVCHHCNKPGHIKPNCPDLAPSKVKQLPPSSIVTRAANNYNNNNKPSFNGPSLKTIATSQTVSSSSSSDVSIKTIDRTIPIDVCSLNVNDHPVLLPIKIHDQLFYGLVDTGASSSCLDPLLPAKFGLKITPVNGKVKNADVRLQSDRIGTCDISAEITIPDIDYRTVRFNVPDDPVTDKIVKLTHTFDVFPVYDRDSGYHFIIGRDILGPLFPHGIPPEYSTPDSHVKLPVFEDKHYSNVVNSMRLSAPVNNGKHISTSLSTVRFNSLTFVDNSDIVLIDVKQTSMINDELQSMQNFINTDIQSLSSDIHDLGAGRRMLLTTFE